METQAKHAKVMLEEQREALAIQQFDLMFLSQLKMLMDIYQHARTASKTDEHVAIILTVKFNDMLEGKGNLNIYDYMPMLSPALDAFDYLVKFVEDFAPPSVGKNKYREMIIANTHVSFRWFIGRSWEVNHPSEKDHRQFLKNCYGIISLPSCAN
jgi:hypothetical protein